MAGLKHKTISGIFWSFLQNVGAKGITILISIFLARLLTPADFGLIGMLSIFIAVSQALVDGGFNQALIQKKGVDEIDYSSVFYINLVVSIILYFILFFSAPFIAEFYKQPQLTSLTRVLSLLFIINAFCYVQDAKLKKDMRFRTLMFIHIPSTIFSGIVSIIMAILGYGVWSIVALQLSMRIAYSVQLWIYSKWKPLRVFDKQRVKTLFSFGGRLMLSGVLETFYYNIYLIVIGKFFPLDTVGYYSNARNLAQTPTQTLAFAIKNVTFPAFSSVQDNDAKLKLGYKKSTEQLLLWTCPGLIFVAVLAEPLFRLVLTDKWLPAVPFFQLLCVTGLTIPISFFNGDIINVKGRSDIFLKLTMVKKVIDTVGIIIAVPFGIWALVWFQAISSLVKLGLNCFYAGKFLKYPLIEQIKELFAPVVCLSLAVAILIYLFNHFATAFPDIVRLTVGMTGGLFLFFYSAKVLKLEMLNEFILIIKKMKGKLSSKKI